MEPHLLSNLLAYGAQVAVVAALGTLIPLVLRIDSARVRYAYWRALVLVCLLLPWVQGRAAAVAREGSAASSAAVVTEAVVASAQVGGPVVRDWGVLLLAVAAVGFVIRLLWMAIGLARLRRLRLAGEPIGPAAHLDDLQAMLGTRAEVRRVAGPGQPLTFGLRRSVVLLPERLREQPAGIQRAVLCHELLHVKRRDWAWLLAEETLRAAFWFHPAIWWLVARVQLAREEVVDQQVVSILGERRSYIQALMTFADETPLAAAPAFARRHHLFRRILLVSKEVAMSPRRIALTLLVAAFVVSAGTVYVVQAFPLMGEQPAQTFQIRDLGGTAPASLRQDQAGPLEQRTNPVTPENPIPRRLSATDPSYPARYLGSGIRARVSVRLTLDQTGAVAEARVLSADFTGGVDLSALTQPLDLEPFRAAAVDAARRWLYAPPAEPPIGFTVVFTFDEGTVRSSQAGPVIGLPPIARAPVPAPGARGRQGGPVPASGAQSSATVGSQVGMPTPGPAPEVPAPGTPIRVGGAIRPPIQVRRVNPEYPPLALAARVQGVVILELTVGVDGRVSDVRVLRSLPLLDQAAIDAVRLWEYSPTLLNGAPVPVVMTVTVQFMLPEPEPVQPAPHQ